MISEDKVVLDRVALRSMALTGILVLACFYTLYFAREFFLPITLAFVLHFLLWPVVRGLARLHIPEWLGAIVVLLVVLGGVGAIGWQMSGPISEWIGRAPEITQKLQRQLRELKKPVERMSKATEQVRSITDTSPAGAKQPVQVAVKNPGVGELMLSRGWSLIFGFMVLIILLYFLLASGDLFLRKLIHVLPTLRDRKNAVQIAREIEYSISRYLVTVALINASLGTCGGIAFWLLGLPDPAVWGLMGALLNFIPFLGAATTIVIVTLVSSATFSTPWHIALPPLAYLALATIEGNFVSPWVVGRRMTLNPVVIFIGLTFWGWLWGIPGALLAVPLLVTFKIVCDHTEPLEAVSEFLGK